VPLRRAALVALLAGPMLGRAEPFEWRASALLHGRATARENEPQALVRFDPGTLAFRVDDYLRPVADQRYLSGFAALSLEGRSGRWRLDLSIDTGELRRTSAPAALSVCDSDPVTASGGSPTGLALLPDGPCNRTGPPRRAVVATYVVPSTGDGPASLRGNGRPFSTELERTALVREATVGFFAGPNGFAHLRAGRHRFVVADGFVYDDYGLGLEAQLDLGALGPLWEVTASAFWPTRDWPGGAARRSPLVSLRVDREVGFLDRVGLFAAWAHDETDGVADLFHGAAVEAQAIRLQGLAPGTTQLQREARRMADLVGRSLEGSADLAWAGLSGNLSPRRGHRLVFTAAVAAGRVRITGPTADDAVTVSVLGTMASARWEVRALPDLLLGLRLLWISGDRPPAESARLEREVTGRKVTYRGFLGVAPWVTATSLFFAGGLADTFAARQASAPGVNGRGAWGPVGSATWDPLPSLRLEARGAWLFAPVVGPYGSEASALGPTGGRVYGPEVDLGARWSPLRWLALSAEADALWPGDFFPRPRRTVVKIIGGFDVLFP